MSLSSVFLDLMHNVRMVAALEKGQTLIVNGNELLIETRTLFQGLRRMVSVDGRYQTLNAIHKTIVKLREIMASYVHVNCYGEEQTKILSNLQTLSEIHEAFNNGLKTLSNFSRYQQDLNFGIRITEIVQESDRLMEECNQLLQRHT